MLAGLPYLLWPIGSVFILASRKKEDPFLYYHAVQALIWGCSVLICTLVSLVVLAITFRLAPSSGGYFSGFFGVGILLAAGFMGMMVFFSAIFLGWRATEGEMLKIPFMGDFAENKMLDSTGMTRKDFIEMLEKSLSNPQDVQEPIPFPPATDEELFLSGRAAEVVDIRAREEVPASMKASELLAKRKAETQVQASIPAQVQARAQDLRRQVADSPTKLAGMAKENISAAKALAQEPVVKKYSLIAPKQPKPVPPKDPVSLASLKAVPSGKVKDLDLVRHYKERSAQPKSNDDVLRSWLSSVDE